MKRPQHGAVRITVPARLHLGFLDLNGELGRRYGSLGITLEEPVTRLRLAPAASCQIRGRDRERARGILEALVQRYDLNPALELEIESAIPAHAGLGSGTQLALAVGLAVERLFELGVSPQEIAGELDRGIRSGIGLGAFLQGGVLLDGGRGTLNQPPPILSRFDFPVDWHILLIHDFNQNGVHGEAEIAAFSALPAFPADAAANLCRLVVMKVLPALAERDLERFGAGVTELQAVIGDHFAPAQGGRFASPGVREVLAWLETEGVTGLGQSSWGPTGFAIVGSATQGAELLAEASQHWPASTGLSFAVTGGRNHGAQIDVTPLVRAAP